MWNWWLTIPQTEIETKKERKKRAPPCSFVYLLFEREKALQIVSVICIRYVLCHFFVPRFCQMLLFNLHNVANRATIPIWIHSVYDISTSWHQTPMISVHVKWIFCYVLCFCWLSPVNYLIEFDERYSMCTEKGSGDCCWILKCRWWVFQYSEPFLAKNMTILLAVCGIEQTHTSAPSLFESKSYCVCEQDNTVRSSNKKQDTNLLCKSIRFRRKTKCQTE